MTEGFYCTLCGNPKHDHAGGTFCPKASVTTVMEIMNKTLTEAQVLSTKQVEEVRRARTVVSNLLQYMGLTCDENDIENGVLIEEGHTTSKRFIEAYKAAVDFMEPK